MDLYCFGESGNAYKAALALELSGTTWRAVHVDFFKGETRGAEFRRLNPMGECPVLVDGDTVVTQSGVIQDYVTERSGCHGGATAEEQREVLRWVLWDNHKLSSLTGITRFLINFAPKEKQPQEVIGWLRGRLRNSYGILEAHLAGRDWIVGDGITNADLSCCGYLYYPEPFGFDRAEWPNIDAWLSRLAAHPRWKHPYDLMPGSPADRA